MIWSRAKKIGCGISAGVFLIALAILGPGLLLGALLIGESQRTIFQRTDSPDGWHEARVQFDDGGAISGFDRIVLVKHRWNLSDTPFLSCRAFLADGEAETKLTWLDNSNLLIEHHFKPENVEASAKQCGSVKIIVHAIPPFEGN